MESEMAVAVALVVFPFCLAFAAIADFLTMSIPNRTSGILLGAFMIAVSFSGFDLAQIGLHLAAAGLVFTVCFGLFAASVMGGGDAKLLTASAIWFGFDSSLAAFLLYVSIFGGLLTLAVLLLRSQENLILAARIPVPRLLLTGKKIPYGIAIALGGLAAYPSSPMMQLAFAQLS
ncbi:prepilin peptidase [Sinorhizobium meliloti]|nr:prepilin peptidase [Sinorhizobium meliloti]WKL27392.1 prepilin peptidase [Sinorhizobium meliloti]WKL33005.1 prepilin peptidase [Sinorhizobium meliloti]WKL38774.1 prepilin peptidase [Sinorhizobium meliloti]WKL42264.1 prepilin peptidase [Sinorhizobium meliloti]